MKTFIFAPNLKEYIDYVNSMELNSKNVFYCSSKEKAIKDRNINNSQNISSEAISVSYDEYEKAFWYEIL